MWFSGCINFWNNSSTFDDYNLRPRQIVDRLRRSTIHPTMGSSSSNIEEKSQNSIQPLRHMMDTWCSYDPDMSFQFYTPHFNPKNISILSGNFHQSSPDDWRPNHHLAARCKCLFQIYSKTPKFWKIEKIIIVNNLYKIYFEHLYISY